MRLPPTFTDEGIRAALRLRVEHPALPVLVLSQYVEERYAADLITAHGGAIGYLLKDRVADVTDFLAAITRIGEGATVLDPEVVAQLLSRRPRDERMQRLTAREASTLALIAEGKSNQAIASTLFVSEASVEKYITAIFQKLDLEPDESGNRRVLAALVHLEHGGGHAADRNPLMSTPTPLPPVASRHRPYPPVAPPPPETRGASRVVAILTVALGCAVVLGAIGSAIFSTVAAASVRTDTQTADVAGVESLDVAVDAASLRIEFADVSEATLEVTGGVGVGEWTLERQDDELAVATPHRFGPGWIFGGEVRATLTLPRELEGGDLDAALELSAGELTVDG